MPSSPRIPVAAPSSGGSVRRSVDVDDTATLLALAGPRNEFLRLLAHGTGAEVSQRGQSILLSGTEEQVSLAERFLAEQAGVLRAGGELLESDVTRSLEALRKDPALQLLDLRHEAVVVPGQNRTIVPKTPAQRRYVQAIRSHDLTFGIGPAGTGKTYLAMAMAVSALVEKRVKRIVLTRPAVEAGEKLGFLPGDLAEKVNPYLRPLYDALHDMMDFDKAQALVTRGQIEVAPLAFMRGRTLSDAFVILDEAQNTTSEQMRMFLTRIGHGSRAVVTGDITQVDLPVGARSGLAEARTLLEHTEGIAFSVFTDVDVVRHPLVQRIVLAYEKRDAELLREKEAREQARASNEGARRNERP